jgi:ferredoxin
VSYRVSIDTSLCCGYGGCVRVAPDTFALENGLAVLRGLETSDGSVVEAADACPMGAITVEEAPGLAA